MADFTKIHDFKHLFRRIFPLHKKRYEEKNTSYPFFLFKGIKHIIAKNVPLRCVRSLVAP